MAERREDRGRLDALTTATSGLRPSEDLTDAVMARIADVNVASHSDALLTKLARSTDGLEPSNAFADSVMMSVLSAESTSESLAAKDDSHDALERVARLTADFSVPESFVNAVMDRLPSAASSRRPRWAFADVVTRTGRAALFMAAAVAAACVIFSTYAERRLDADVVSSVDPVEVNE